MVEENTDGFRGREFGTKVKILDVDGSKVGVFRNAGVEESIDGGEGGSVGADIEGARDSIPPNRPSHPLGSDPLDPVPLLPHNPLHICGGFEGGMDGGHAFEGSNELDELVRILLVPGGGEGSRNSEGEGEGFSRGGEVEV